MTAHSIGDAAAATGPRNSEVASHDRHPVDSDPAGAAPVQKSQFARTVGGLATMNGALFVAALVTGPLQAHALGPTGRGEVADILVPTSLTAIIAEFGLGTYAMREAARGRPSGVLLGTIGSMLFAIGLLVAVASEGLAALLVGHRHPVFALLTIGFMLVPVGLLTNLAVGMCAGLQRWRAYSLARLIPPIGTAVLVGGLFVAGWVSVTTVAALSFLLGALALIPVLVAVRDGGPVRFDRTVAREGLSFGFRYWLGSLLGTTSSQIGMLVMIRLAGPAQVGLYVVAQNVAGSTDMVSSAVFGAIFPRVANGDHELAARACRMTILIVGAVSVVGAVAAPIALPIVFGPRFQGSVELVEILLFATVASAASTVLGSFLTAAGRPGILAFDDIIALALGVPGLIVILPLLGVLGAALVMAISAAVGLSILLFFSSRVGGIPMWRFIVVGPADLAWAWDRVPRRFKALPVRLRLRPGLS